MPEAVLSDSSSHAIDLEKLLAPISVDRPSGEWLRDTATYDAIEQARRDEDSSLPRGVWERELRRADWDQVAKLCLEALETRTKDAQVAAWLLEAWIHLDGFAGAGQGLTLLTALYDSFWDDLYPAVEDGDVEHRLMPVRWINDKLSLELKMIPVTRPGAGDGPVYTWADWEAAQHLSQIAANDPATLEQAEARGQATRERFLTSVSLTPSPFYHRLDGELRGTLSAVDELAEVLEGRGGTDAPSLGRFRGTLEAVAHFSRQVLTERAADLPADPEPPVPAPAADPAGVEAPAARRIGGSIDSRAEAYRQLAEAAEYLLRTEPHSPAPYLVKRAVAWGGMTLSELLAELLAGNADLDTVNKLLGLDRSAGA